MKKPVNYFIPKKLKSDKELYCKSRFTVGFIIFVFSLVTPGPAFMIYSIPEQVNRIIGIIFAFVGLLALLIANAAGPMDEQKQFPGKTIGEWKGELEQANDILVIGIRV